MYHRRYHKPYPVLMLAIGLIFLWAAGGCSSYYTARRTSKKLARDIMVYASDLKKTIAIIPFENQSYYTHDNIERLFQNRITETLNSACTNIDLILPTDDRFPKALDTPPRLNPDRVDNLKLVQIGREYGLGAIATGSIVTVSSYEEKRGLFWLRENLTFLQVQIHLEVFDTETGAKLLDENRLEEVEISEDDYLFIKEKRQVPIVELSEKIQASATLLGEKICDALADQPWRSYVVSKDENQVTISSGTHTGIQPGDRYHIHDVGTLVNGIGDEQFLLPGKKVGEIEIIDVQPDRAKAVIVSDNGIRQGGIVKEP